MVYEFQGIYQHSTPESNIIHNKQIAIYYSKIHCVAVDWGAELQLIGQIILTFGKYGKCGYRCTFREVADLSLMKNVRCFVVFAISWHHEDHYRGMNGGRVLYIFHNCIIHRWIPSRGIFRVRAEKDTRQHAIKLLLCMINHHWFFSWWFIILIYEDIVPPLLATCFVNT